MSIIHLFKKMKHWNPDIIGYWVIGAGCEIEKDLELSPRPPNCSKNSFKLLFLFISINWPSLVTLWVVVQEIYSKIHPILSTNTHHDVTDLANFGMLKSRKTWISWEWNINFIRNKKFLNLCIIWHIFRSYRFVAELTLNNIRREKLFYSIQHKNDCLANSDIFYMFTQSFKVYTFHFWKKWFIK